MSVCPHCVAAGIAGLAASIPVVKYLVLPKLALLKKDKKEDNHAR